MCTYICTVIRDSTWTLNKQCLSLTSYSLGHYQQECHLLVMPPSLVAEMRYCCWIQVALRLLGVLAPDPPVWDQSDPVRAYLCDTFTVKPVKSGTNVQHRMVVWKYFHLLTVNSSLCRVLSEWRIVKDVEGCSDGLICGRFAWKDHIFSNSVTCTPHQIWLG